MIKHASIFATETPEDFTELNRQLQDLVGDSVPDTCWDRYKEDTVVYVRNYVTYDKGEVANTARNPVQQFKVGMELMPAHINSPEYFIATGSSRSIQLEKLEALKQAVAELEAELTEPLYKVVLPNPNAAEGSHLTVLGKYMDEDKVGKVYLGKVKPSTLTYADFNSRYILTEEEIKEDFEWAWQFAERVQ